MVIVGGGLTGLSTALALKKRGVDAVILEKSFCGYGSSGRNAGHMTPTIGKDIPSTLRMFGHEKAKQLLHFGDQSIRHTLNIMQEYGIDCDYVANGNIVAAVHPSQDENLRKTAKIAQELGAAVEYLDANHMRQKGIPSAFSSGIWETLGGVLHPGKYVLGLRRAALHAGVRIYEESPMVSMQEGARPVVHTQNGSVTADYYVQATNAYTNSTGRLKKHVLPMRVTLFETERLTDVQLARLGWQGQEGIYTAHEMLENFRMTKYGTLQGGSKLVRSAFGGGLPEGYHQPTFAALEGIFRDRFPELTDVKIATWWGGWVGLTTNFLPKIGAHPKQANVLHSIGYNGHGIPQTTMSGTMLADRITGADNPHSHLFAAMGLAWPPEPFTWLASKALTGVFGAMDRRTDNLVRQARSHQQ